MKRSSGILLHFSSLPSEYGIGTLGKEAYKFVDFLSASHQSYWQILPIGHTTFGDSPYSTISTFAGNPYFIDFDLLRKDGLLKKKDYQNIKWFKKTSEIDYAILYKQRYKVLKIAVNNFKINHAYNNFLNNNKWVNDYSLFMSIKDYFNGSSWLEWPKEYRFRNSKVINEFKKTNKDDIKFWCVIQFLFFKQFNNLKKYMNNKGIKLIGDIPIYVPLDSVECWSNPKYFLLNKNLIPKKVAGVPPDCFTADGQLWGNPIYDYKEMKKNNYKWWIDRFNIITKIYDVVRIDHFRGFESFWSVPYGEKTARNGKWVKGPNMDLLNVIKRKFPKYEFIAEDLGYLTDEVREMLNNFSHPGMKVLQFGFDSREKSYHAPHTYFENTVCYIGTHDNSTIIGWLFSADKNDVKYALKYLGLKDTKNFNWDMIRVGMSSVSRLFIVQMQDYLGLDDSSRMNTPGTIGINWKWRMYKKDLNNKLINRIKVYTDMYQRY